jgi:hypothetical protein
LASLTLIEEKHEKDLIHLEPADLAPGWEAEGAVVCIGGRTPLDDTGAALLSELLEKLGLKRRLSYMSIGPSPAHVRYLIRRLRGIIPSSCTILVGYWAANANGAVKALKQTAEADAYATSLKQAAEIVIDAARTSAAEKRNARARIADKSLSDAPLKLVREESDD